MRSMSTMIEFARLGRYPSVYDMPPPRGTTGSPDGAIAFNARARSSVLPGRMMAAGNSPERYTSVE